MHKYIAFENPLVKYVLCIYMYLFMYGNLRTLKIVSVRISNGFFVSFFPPLVTSFSTGFSSVFFCIPFLSSKCGMCRMIFIFPFAVVVLPFFSLPSLSMLLLLVMVVGWLVGCFVRSLSFASPIQFNSHPLHSSLLCLLCFRWYFGVVICWLCYRCQRQCLSHRRQ